MTSNETAQVPDWTVSNFYFLRFGTDFEFVFGQVEMAFGTILNKFKI